MIGDKSKIYCPICESEQEHLQGCFKVQNIDGEIFHFTTTSNDSIRKISNGFKDFVVDQREGFINSDTPDDFVQTRSGRSAFEELFAQRVRSLKCSRCSHLKKISRFP